MREQVEALEHHADFAAHLVDALEIGRQFGAVHDDLPFLVFLQAVDAADQRGLARTRGAGDDDAFAPHDLEVDIPQDVKVAIPLVHAHDIDGHVGVGYFHMRGVDRAVDGCA